MNYYVYVIKNTNNNKIYIGQTSNLENRLQRHNGRLPSKKQGYTSVNKAGGNWVILYKEIFLTRKEAIIREKEIKSYQGRQFIRNKLGC